MESYGDVEQYGPLYPRYFTSFRDEMRLDLAEFEERWRKGLR